MDLVTDRQVAVARIVPIPRERIRDLITAVNRPPPTRGRWRSMRSPQCRNMTTTITAMTTTITEMAATESPMGATR